MNSIEITSLTYDTAKNITTVTFTSQDIENTRIFEGKPTMQEVINFYAKSENVTAIDSTGQSADQATKKQ